ncbi:MAG: metallophosphoesterase family protein, partial [bacterium]
MKLALISDIHSNIEALDSVLEHIDSTFSGTRLVCAGDVVGYGPDPLKCIDRLVEREALCVVGNHDEMVLGRRSFDHCVYAGITAAVWTKRNLTLDAKAYLDALPGYLNVTPNVAVCHGNLQSADTYIDNSTAAEEALRQLRDFQPETNILICGHTHHAAIYSPRPGFSLMHAQSECRLDPNVPFIINPGAVGQSRDGKPLARYAILDTEKKVVSFQEVAYDHPATIRKLRRVGLVPIVTLLPPRGIW